MRRSRASSRSRSWTAGSLTTLEGWRRVDHKGNSQNDLLIPLHVAQSFIATAGRHDKSHMSNYVWRKQMDAPGIYAVYYPEEGVTLQNRSAPVPGRSQLRPARRGQIIGAAW